MWRCARSHLGEAAVLDAAESRWHSSAHDHHPDLGGRPGCWGDHSEPMGLAASARVRGWRCDHDRGNRTCDGRHAHSISCGRVDAGHGRRPGPSLSRPPAGPVVAGCARAGLDARPRARVRLKAQVVTEVLRNGGASRKPVSLWSRSCCGRHSAPATLSPARQHPSLRVRAEEVGHKPTGVTFVVAATRADAMTRAASRGTAPVWHRADDATSPHPGITNVWPELSRNWPAGSPSDERRRVPMPALWPLPWALRC